MSTKMLVVIGLLLGSCAATREIYWQRTCADLQLELNDADQVNKKMDDVLKQLRPTPPKPPQPPTDKGIPNA